jgi:two-component system sensor histidine kinase MprB
MSTHPCLPHEDLAAYAHELRGALTVIAGYTELLRRPLRAAERDSALDGIERAIRRADALCADALRGVAPSSAAKAFGLLSLSLLAEEVAADQRTATGRIIDVTAQGSAMVLGDADGLTRVLGNLIDNAAKYSLSSAPIDVRITEEEGALAPLSVVEVADRGPGIPEAELERVFEPLARLERDAGRPGTGLGLGIARTVAESHDGHLRIGPRDGGGTVVRLELPRA